MSEKIGVWVKLRGAGRDWLKKVGSQLEVKEPRKKKMEGVRLEGGREDDLWGEEVVKGSLILVVGEPSSGKSYTLSSKGQGLLHRRIAKTFHLLARHRLPLGQIHPNPDGTFSYHPRRVTPVGSTSKCSGIPIKSRTEAVPSVKYSTFVSQIEITQDDRVYDLLEKLPPSKERVIKKIKENSQGLMFVENAMQLEVRSGPEASSLFKALPCSCKSHIVYIIWIVRVTLTPESNSITTFPLTFVDLASPQTGRNIVNAYKALQECIFTIYHNNQENNQFNKVPFEKSKLIYLLKNYFLKGNAKIGIIFCLYPALCTPQKAVNLLRLAEICQKVILHRLIPEDQGSLQGNVEPTAVPEGKEIATCQIPNPVYHSIFDTIFKNFYNNYVMKPEFIYNKELYDKVNDQELVYWRKKQIVIADKLCSDLKGPLVLYNTDEKYVNIIRQEIELTVDLRKIFSEGEKGIDYNSLVKNTESSIQNKEESILWFNLQVKKMVEEDRMGFQKLEEEIDNILSKF